MNPPADKPCLASPSTACLSHCPSFLDAPGQFPKLDLPNHIHPPIMPASVVAELEAVLKGTTAPETDSTIAKRAHYSPPWADVSIIGIAGSSGSGKSTLSQAIVNKLNLPWVVILSIVSLKAVWGGCNANSSVSLVVGLVLQEPGCRIVKKSVPQRVRL